MAHIAESRIDMAACAVESHRILMRSRELAVMRRAGVAFLAQHRGIGCLIIYHRTCLQGRCCIIEGIIDRRCAVAAVGIVVQIMAYPALYSLPISFGYGVVRFI